MQGPRKTGGSASVFRLIPITILLLATSQPQPAQSQDDVIRVRTDLVGIPVIVNDSRGRRLSGLQAEDFKVTDEGVPARIEYCAAGADKVALLFALDASGSAREILSQQRETAMALFAKFGHASRIAALHFGEVVRLAFPFTSDAEAAQTYFMPVARETKGTAIFDAAATAVRSFDGTGGFSTERRIVILISDGLDTLSSIKPAQVISLAKARGVSFYVIHFQLFTPADGRLAPRPASKGFRELADQTGGRYFKFGDSKLALNPNAHYDLAPVFQAIDNDLRGQYVIGFYPSSTARDGRMHRVTVMLTNRENKKLKLLQLKTDYTLKD